MNHSKKISLKITELEQKLKMLKNFQDIEQKIITLINFSVHKDVMSGATTQIRSLQDSINTFAETYKVEFKKYEVFKLLNNLSELVLELRDISMEEYNNNRNKYDFDSIFEQLNTYMSTIIDQMEKL